jgi:hypothetical protein
MKRFLFPNRVRHPFFPDLAAAPAAGAREREMAVAGTRGELARAAAAGVRPRRAVFVLAREDEFVSDGERDELWRAFQVPVSWPGSAKVRTACTWKRAAPCVWGYG